MKRNIAIAVVCIIIGCLIGTLCTQLSRTQVSPNELIDHIRAKTEHTVENLSISSTNHPNYYMEGHIVINGVESFAILHKDSWVAKFECESKELCFTVGAWSVIPLATFDISDADKSKWRVIVNRMNE